MSEILVFSNENAKAVTDVLNSMGDNWPFLSLPFTDGLKERESSRLKCIIVCFREDEINTTLESSCQTLENFIKNNQINSKIPIIPIVYGVESAESYPKTLKNWFNNHKSLNFLKKELVWFKDESAEKFKNKLQKANYTSGYPVPKSSFDDDELSGKNASIAKTVATVVKWVFIVLGVIVGTVAGGLIGGLVIGGLAAALTGVAIGLVSGSIAGWLTARGLCGAPEAAAAEEAENRSNVLQQHKELKDRNEQWEIFQENFFPSNSVSHMTPLLQSREIEITSEPQKNYQPLFRQAKSDQGAEVSQPQVSKSRQGLPLDENQQTAFQC